MRDFTYIPSKYESRDHSYEAAHGRDEAAKRDLEFIRAHQHEPFNAPTHLPTDPWMAEELTRIIEWVKRHEDTFQEWPENASREKPPFYEERFYEWTWHRRHLLAFNQQLARGLTDVILSVLDEVYPAIQAVGPAPLAPLATVPVYQLLTDVPGSIDRIYRLFTELGLRVESTAMFERIGRVLKSNHYEAERELNISGSSKRPFQLALTDRQFIEFYLKGTPFKEMFERHIHLPWRFKERLNHTHIIGRTDSGKTTLIERIVHQDLLDPAKPSIVVLTPHGDLVRKLRSLASPLSDRMLVIDPSAEKFPPAINPFSTKRRVSPNSVIKTFDYILAALDLELTAKQRALWKPTIRMLLSLPEARGRNATILDIRDFMLRPESYKDVIDRLEDPSFFYDHVFTPASGKSQFDSTRSELGYRLSEILSDPAIRKALSVQETKVDFFEELQYRQAVILIDTAKHHLADGSSLFGGMMLALIFQAILARDAIPEEGKRYPTFVYVDEAANYFSGDVSDMLTELRKFRCGLILAHHDLEQARKRSPQLADSLVSQPGIRFAAPSAKDAPELAREMNTAPTALTNLPQHHFAVFVRGVTPHPIPTKIAPLSLPQMSKAAQEVFKWKNRDRISFGPPMKPTVDGAAASPQAPDEEVSREW